MYVDVTEEERVQLLVALWSRDIMQRKINEDLPPEALVAGLIVNERRAALVTKLGGDPTLPLYGVEPPRRSSHCE